MWTVTWTVTWVLVSGVLVMPPFADAAVGVGGGGERERVRILLTIKDD